MDERGSSHKVKKVSSVSCKPPHPLHEGSAGTGGSARAGVGRGRGGWQGNGLCMSSGSSAAPRIPGEGDFLLGNFSTFQLYRLEKD